jgi:hypothetical protein
MKESEILIGKKYMFGRTDTEHKKIMSGGVFTVISCKKGKQKCSSNYRNNKGKSPNRYLLDNGFYAKAGELKQI